MLLVLIGPPAVGKMTVGRALCAISDFRLFHNHMTIEPLAETFGYGTAAFNRLNEEFRERVLTEASAAGLDLVFTLVLDLDDPSDTAYLRRCGELFGGELAVVELRADLDTRLARNRTEQRLADKRSKRDIAWSDDNVRGMEAFVMTTARPTASDEFLATVPHLVLDNADLTPEEAAAAILAWLRPPDAALASGLNRLKTLAESEGPPMTIERFDVRQEITIAAPRARVWEALTAQPDQWWGAPYLLTNDYGQPVDLATTLNLPLEVGAPVTERRGDATELWGIVTVVDPGRAYGWTGAMGMAQPAWGEVRYTLADVEAGTSVVVTHGGMCGDAEAGRGSYDHGWHDLNERLRAWVEEGVAHGVAGDNTEVPGFTH